jgi:hypothetical protein
MVPAVSVTFNQLTWLIAWNDFIIFTHHDSFKSYNTINVQVYESVSYFKPVCFTYLNRYMLCNLIAIIVHTYVAWERFAEVDISETQF